ncbi:MAG: hypothetical protein ACXVXN_01590 [Mycobacteriaceae bacterium]
MPCTDLSPADVTAMGLEPGVADLGRSVSTAIAGGWTGQGADTAANVTGEYVARGNELAAALKLTSTNFHLAAVGASETRARVATADAD